VLAFEAQHNLPYDLDEVVWDGEAISNDGIESEVLLGACKSDMINGFCEIMRQSGFLIESINASAILSYSALKFAKPDLGEDILLINVGARSSTLFFKNDEGFFVRTINFGGNTLTQFISDTLGKGFSESDEIKHRFFDKEEGVDEESSAYKLMQTCIANFSRRFAQEVNRSIVMYRRQKS
jgi:Tfp pilus assembly PilM family ATPase